MPTEWIKKNGLPVGAGSLLSMLIAWQAWFHHQLDEVRSWKARIEEQVTLDSYVDLQRTLTRIQLNQERTAKDISELREEIRKLREDARRGSVDFGFSGEFFGLTNDRPILAPPIAFQ